MLYKSTAAIHVFNLLFISESYTCTTIFTEIDCLDFPFQYIYSNHDI